MTELLDAGLPLGHPHSLYVHNLRAGQGPTWFSAIRAGQGPTWFSATATPKELADYVRDLLLLPHSSIEHSENGFARTRDGSIFMICVSGQKGTALSVWGYNDEAVAIMNAGIQCERVKVLDEMIRGGTKVIRRTLNGRRLPSGV